MARGPSSGDFRRAARKAQSQANSDARKLQRKANVDARRNNRDLASKMSKVIKDGNRDAERRARRLQRSAASVPDTDHDLLQEFGESLAEAPAEDNDLFLSYVRSDGWQVAGSLHDGLVAHGVSVWFDEAAMRLGKSQARQMDQGLLHARGGVVLLTPEYLTGRFWPERELAALLNKPTVIPVLHDVTFGQVAAYSALLADLHGLSTDKYSAEQIAALIADEVLDEEVA